jgi:hypothetical protein
MISNATTPSFHQASPEQRDVLQGRGWLRVTAGPTPGLTPVLVQPQQPLLREPPPHDGRHRGALLPGAHAQADAHGAAQARAPGSGDRRHRGHGPGQDPAAAPGRHHAGADLFWAVRTPAQGQALAEAGCRTAMFRISRPSSDVGGWFGGVNAARDSVRSKDALSPPAMLTFRRLLRRKLQDSIAHVSTRAVVSHLPIACCAYFVFLRWGHLPCY